MRNVVYLVAIAAVAGALVWWMQSTSEPPAKAAPPEVGLAVRAHPEPLPGLDAGVAQVKDAQAPPDAALTAELVVHRGALGMPVALVEQALTPAALGGTWTRVPGPTPTWKSPRGATVALIVEEGRVVGGRLQLAKDSATADVQTASPVLVGQYCGLDPVGSKQADTSLGQHRSGSFDCGRGETIYYRGEIHYIDGAPRPQWFEYRLEPF